MKKEVFAGATILIVLLLLVGAGVWQWYNQDFSIYAPQFSEEGFSQVMRGMNEADVYSILGSPVSIETVEMPEMWVYEEVDIDRSLFNSMLDLEKELSAIIFTEDGRVGKVTGRHLAPVKVGMKKYEVISMLGEPQRITPRMFRVLHYTAPSGSGLYRARIIALDDLGNVVNIVAYDMHD